MIGRNAFHLSSPTISYTEIIKWITTEYSLQEVSLSQFLSEIKSDPSNPLYPVAHYFRRKVVPSFPGYFFFGVNYSLILRF